MDGGYIRFAMMVLAMMPEKWPEGRRGGCIWFLDFGGYVVDAEGIEDGFGAAEDEEAVRPMVESGPYCL